MYAGKSIRGPYGPFLERRSMKYIKYLFLIVLAFVLAQVDVKAYQTESVTVVATRQGNARIYGKTNTYDLWNYHKAGNKGGYDFISSRLYLTNRNEVTYCLNNDIAFNSGTTYAVDFEGATLKYNTNSYIKDSVRIIMKYGYPNMNYQQFNNKFSTNLRSDDELILVTQMLVWSYTNSFNHTIDSTGMFAYRYQWWVTRETAAKGINSDGGILDYRAGYDAPTNNTMLHGNEIIFNAGVAMNKQVKIDYANRSIETNIDSINTTLLKDSTIISKMNGMGIGNDGSYSLSNPKLVSGRYIFGPFTVQSNMTMQSYSLSSTNSNILFTNAEGGVVNSYGNGQQFYISLRAEDIENANSSKIMVTTNFVSTAIQPLIYMSSASSQQPMLIASDGNLVKNNKIVMTMSLVNSLPIVTINNNVLEKISGEKMSKVRVIAYDDFGNEVASALTDNNGTCQIKVLGNKKYYIQQDLSSISSNFTKDASRKEVGSSSKNITVSNSFFNQLNTPIRVIVEDQFGKKLDNVKVRYDTATKTTNSVGAVLFENIPIGNHLFVLNYDNDEFLVDINHIFKIDVTYSNQGKEIVHKIVLHRKIDYYLEYLSSTTVDDKNESTIEFEIREDHSLIQPLKIEVYADNALVKSVTYNYNPKDNIFKYILSVSKSTSFTVKLVVADDVQINNQLTIDIRQPSQERFEVINSKSMEISGIIKTTINKNLDISYDYEKIKVMPSFPSKSVIKAGQGIDVSTSLLYENEVVPHNFSPFVYGVFPTSELDNLVNTERQAKIIMELVSSNYSLPLTYIGQLSGVVSTSKLVDENETFLDGGRVWWTPIYYGNDTYAYQLELENLGINKMTVIYYEEPLIQTFVSTFIVRPVFLNKPFPNRDTPSEWVDSLMIFTKMKEEIESGSLASFSSPLLFNDNLRQLLNNDFKNSWSDNFFSFINFFAVFKGGELN